MPKFNAGQRVKHVETGKMGSPYFFGNGVVVRYQGGQPYVRWGNGMEGTVPEDELQPAGSYSKSKISKIVGEELRALVKEASKDYTAQCMDCGTYFTTKSQNPKNCPKCLGRDIDVLAEPEDNQLTKESVLKEALSPAAARVYTQFRKEFEDPSSQVLKLFANSVISSRYLLIQKAAKGMGINLPFKDVQEVGFQLAYWLKKERGITVKYPRRPPQTSEASRSFPVKCMECGKKFKTSSMLPTCPKCGGSDVEVAESIQEAEFQGIAYKRKPKNEVVTEDLLSSREEAEKLADLLGKIPNKTAKGAEKMLRSPTQWKVIARNPMALKAVLDIIKDTPEFKEWKRRNVKGESSIQEKGKEINVRQTTPQPTERKASEEARKLGFRRGFHIMNTPYGWVASEYRTSFDPGRQKND